MCGSWGSGAVGEKGRKEESRAERGVGVVLLVMLVVLAHCAVSAWRGARPVWAVEAAERMVVRTVRVGAKCMVGWLLGRIMDWGSCEVGKLMMEDSRCRSLTLWLLMNCRSLGSFLKELALSKFRPSCLGTQVIL